MKKLGLLLSLIAGVFISCLMLTQTTQATQGSQTAQATFSDCDQVFTGILRYHSGDTRFFDEFSAGDHDRRITRFDVNFFEPYDYNNGGNPEFDWTDYIRQAKGKVSKGQTMRIIQASGENAWYYVDALPPKRLYNNLGIQYIVQYASNSDKTPVETHKECKYYAISWCGDGILDREYGETCDPKAEPWINNNECDPVTCKGPICNSSYNGQTVSSLVPGNYLCNVGTMTNFQETSTGWTWKCDNVAGTDANCSAKKANNGRLDVEKTLVSETKYVTEVGQELIWEIKVTAKGGNVENVKIKDYLPEVLSYKDKSTVPTLPQGVTMKSTEPTKGADATGSYLQWDTEGTLTAGKSIILRITTKVKTMPKTTDEYENVACARTEGLDEKCDKKPVAKEGEPIIKKTLIGNKTVENVGDILKWKIEITASGGDVSGFVLQDKVPVALEYVNIEVKGNEDNLTIGNPTGPELSGKYNIYTWNVKGVLKSEHKLILEMTTKVKSMPTSEDDYKNVACVIKNGKENCDDDKPGNPDLRIEKEIINKDGNLVFYEGDTITYRIRFGNRGNVAATITSIKDFLPKNVQYKSGSIHINRSSTHEDGIQVGDMDLIKGFKVVDGVRIEIYGGMTLEPGDEGEIIITGTILGDYTNNTTNFACIYLNDKLVNCADASHTLRPEPRNQSCRDMKVDGSTVTCYSNGISTRFRLKCGNSIIDHSSTERKTKRSFDNVHCSEEITCEVLDSYMGTQVGQVCKEGPNESEASQQCFNVNAGNFSIHEGEIFPFYWNLFNMENWVKDNKDNYVEVTDYRKAPENYNNKYNDADCTEGNIAKDSMVCTFKIYYGGGNETPLYKIEGPCLTSENSKPLENNDLLKARYTEMKRAYCNDPDSKSCYFSYNDERDDSKSLLPSAVYYIKNFGSEAELNLDGSKWEGNRGLAYNKDNEKNAPYGEYKIRLESVKYLQCVGGKWEQKDASDDADFKPCESNFVLTNPYTVQKTPSGNLTASTKELGKYKYLSGSDVFSSLINAIETTNYESNNQVENAMETFISKYSKLAVEVKLGSDSFLEGTKIKKVPGKNIYFVDGDLTIKGGQAIKTSFTIVQTNETKTVRIVGNVQHNMMLLTKGNIVFQGNNCTEDQTVKGIFYAKGKLNRSAQYRNNVTTSNVWCTGGGLHIKGVLIGNNFDNLMKHSRSHLNDWFEEENKKKSVMDGASVLIEYSPSIFSKSTMPPGAEDFTTALSVYKN